MATAQHGDDVVEAVMAEARAKIEAGDPHAGLSLLISVSTAAASDDTKLALGELLFAIGVQLDRSGKLDGALAANERTLAILRDLRGDGDDPEIASVLNSVASCLRRLGRLSEAKGKYEAVMAMRQRLYGDVDHPDIAHSATSLGHIAGAMNQHRESLAHYERALAMHRRVLGDADDQSIAIGLSLVATALRRNGRFEESLSRYEESLAMQRRLNSGVDDADVVEAIDGIASCLEGLGKHDEALPQFEVALAMVRRMHGDRDHAEVARVLNDAAGCMRSMGRWLDARPLCEEAVAMARRLNGDRPHPATALYLSNLASCLLELALPVEAMVHADASLAMALQLANGRDAVDVAEALRLRGICLPRLGRGSEALAALEESLAQMKRIYGTDHPSIVRGLGDVGDAMREAGRAEEAISLHTEALAMGKRVFGDRAAFLVAREMTHLGLALADTGRAREAIALHEASLALRRRMFANRDHRELATGLQGQAEVLQAVGRASDALPLFEAAVRMMRRLHPTAVHPDVASSLSGLALCYESLGRASEALPLLEEVLAIARNGKSHRPSDVAACLHNLGLCLQRLKRHSEAIAIFEAALAMKRESGDPDGRSVAATLNSMALTLLETGRAAEALPLLQESVAIRRRVCGDGDHPTVALGVNNLAYGLRLNGRLAAALPLYREALAMRQRVWPGLDHPEVAQSLGSVAHCLQMLGKPADALAPCQEAVAMIERLRESSRTSSAFRQSLFEELKRGDSFERLQLLRIAVGDAAAAMEACERSRGRELLDALEQQCDTMAEAIARASRRGDSATVTRLEALRRELDGTELAIDRSLHELVRLDESNTAAAPQTGLREGILRRSAEAHSRYRQLLDERARAVADVTAAGRVRTAAEVRSVLQDGELLLEFTLTPEGSFVYVSAREGGVQALPLPTAHAVVQDKLSSLLPFEGNAAPRRGREPGRDPESSPRTASGADETLRNSAELFQSLIPSALWSRVQSARRVFVAAHRELHRLPFESLVTGSRDGKPVFWLDGGPPVSYVPSGSVLHWLRRRAADVADDTTSVDLLAVGDPSTLAAGPQVPSQGVLLLLVKDGGAGARAGLRQGDVIVGYDSQEMVDDRSLRDAIARTEAAIEDGRRDSAPVPVDVWRQGGSLAIRVSAGRLDIEVGKGPARAAFEATSSELYSERSTRAGDLERLGKLPPLRGARAETTAIAKVFGDRHKKVVSLLGAEANEVAVFDVATKAKYLHFACHGIAEEHAGQSLSMLVLSQPQRVLPGDDGFLSLSNLYDDWRGRVSSCRLVVLSACRTNVGPTLRDEAPQALPIGFLFAGAPRVISSLWAVDDESTRELMTDFYSRLLAEETDALSAFAAAKKALRQKYADPWHWAPFLFIGSPH